MRKRFQAWSKAWSMAFLVVALTAIVPHSAAKAADVICYNCPPQWADFATMLKQIKADLGYDIPFDNKNSGQSMSQIIAEKANPVADVVYWGVDFGMKAKAAGDLIEPYKPQLSEQVPPGLKDPDGYWTTIHSGTLGLFVNKDALGGAPVPACWKDLLKPQYKGMVGYLDPSSAAVGFVGAVAVNTALGGSDTDRSRPVTVTPPASDNGAPRMQLNFLPDSKFISQSFARTTEKKATALLNDTASEHPKQRSSAGCRAFKVWFRALEQRLKRGVGASNIL